MEQIDWTTLLTTDRVVELHAEALRRFNQEQLAIGTLHRDCVEGKIGNAQLAESYSAEDETARRGLCFAGYLMFYLVKGHCFPDGNKRVGWIAAMTVLAELGLTIDATDDDAETLVLRIANGEAEDGIEDAGEVVRWLAERLEAPDANGH